MNLERHIVPGVPTLLMGPPGIGKTASVYRYAKSKGLHLETIIASIRDSTDFSGMPVPDLENGVMRYLPQDWAKRFQDNGGGVLFLDEINTAPPTVQHALLRVVLERVVGDYKLPDNVAIIAAANPIDSATFRWRLDPALITRFKVIKVNVDTQDWIAGFPTYWGDPPSIPGLDENTWRGKRALVAAFIHHRPDMILQPPKEESGDDENWPCPRTWDYVSRCLTIHDRVQELFDDIEGCIGSAAAREFVTWATNLDLPDPVEFMEHPQSYRWPDRGDKVYALLTAVVLHGLENEARWNQAWSVIVKAAEDNMPDLAVMAARQLLTADPKRTSGFKRTVSIAPLAPLLRAAGELP